METQRDAMLRVLVVDDDEGIRETLTAALGDAGYTVVAVEDGLAALDILRSTRDHLVVLLDLMMPKLDGAGVLGAVSGDRALTQRHGYILMTASHRTLSLAFVHLLADLEVLVLRKPFDIDNLLGTVQRVAQRLHEPA